MATEKITFEQQLVQLRTAYKAQLPQKIIDIRAGWINLNAEFSTDAVTLLHRNIHSLVGSSATFGFTAISKLARELGDLLKPLLATQEALFTPDDELQDQVKNIMEKFSTLLNASATTEPETGELADTDPATQTQAGKLYFKTPAEEILIYYLDDAVAAPELLIQNLINYGFPSKHFRSMNELLSAAHKNPPNLVILDLIMPDIAMDKVFSLARSLVDLGVKVFMLSARDDFSYRLQAVRAGIDAYIVKPANMPALVGKIRNILQLRQMNLPHILIVDDQESVAQFYCTVLTQAGMRVTSEGNPENVLEIMKTNTPDLVLLDLNMPDVSGVELAAIIRQHDKYQSIPILFLSADANPNMKTVLLEIGSDDLLSKGMQQEELVRQIKTRVERAAILTGMMYQDSLTGLLNHAQIQLAAERLFLQNKRKKETFAIAMIDIDKFKNVNDTYGHLTGDLVIKTLAQLLEQRLRTTDYIGRFGGEEFMLVLPDTNVHNASILINNLRKAFAAIKFKKEDITFNVSFSAGVAENTGINNFIEQIKMADLALYKAKNRGRNLVCASLPGDTNE